MQNQIINASGVIDVMSEAKKELLEKEEALHFARIAYMESTGSANANNQTYANAMVGMFGEQWWTIADKKIKKLIKAERANFVEGLQSLGFESGTIDTYWMRVKKACGYVPNSNRVSGSETIDSKVLKELKTILNRIYAENADSEGCELSRKALENLKLAFTTMGGNLENDLTK
jgi:N-glycosylase/DNA lyase